MPKNQDRDADLDEVTDFVVRGGGPRLFGQRRLVRRCCEWASAEWPGPDEELVAAVLRRRAREESGSVVAAMLVSVLANLIARLIVQWWKSRHKAAWLIRFDADAP